METATLQVRARGATEDTFTGYSVERVKLLQLSDEELSLVGGALVAHNWRKVLSWSREHTLATRESSQTRSPAAAVSVAPGTAWSAPTNVFASDDAAAAASLSASAGLPGTSETLRATGFGFTLPAGATPLGLLARVERRVSSVAAGRHSADHTVQLRKASGAAPDNKALAADWGTTDAVVAYGGAGDLWGASWTADEVNDAAFGLDFRCQLSIDSGFALNISHRVDHAEVQAFYRFTDAAPAPKVSDVWLRADGTRWAVRTVQTRTLETRFSCLCQLVPTGA